MTDEEKIKLENKIAFLENTVTIMQQRLKSLGKKYSEDLEKVNGELLKILQLQKENAALRERLENAVELPLEDRVWYIAEDEEGQESYIISKPTSSLAVEELKYEMDKKYFSTREAAEKRLAELNGGKQ